MEKTTINSNDLFTTTQVAELLGMTRQNVYWMIKKSKIETVENGSTFNLIPGSEVKRLMRLKGVSSD